VISAKKRAANQRNAQGSTGPSSVAGKAASRMNALKSGLYAKSLVIRGESQEEFEELARQFNEQYHPVTPQARVLVDILIRNTWFLRRYDRIEGEEWATRFTRVDELRYTDTTHPIAVAFELGSVTLDRVRKYVETAERSIARALKQLDRLTEHIPDPAEEALLPAPPAVLPVSSQPVSPAFGFVPSALPETAAKASRPVIARPPLRPAGFVSLEKRSA
jgi:hypothetical protein